MQYVPDLLEIFSECFGYAYLPDTLIQKPVSTKLY